MKDYFRRLGNRINTFLKRFSFKTGLIILSLSILFYILSFAQMTLDFSYSIKGILWVVFFGLAKTFQYAGLVILGVEGIKRLKVWLSKIRKKYLGIMKTKTIVILIISMFLMTSVVQKSNAENLYDFTAKTQSGEELNLNKYKGEVLLIVNTASKCGFTPQYSDLESLYEKYHDKGFDILDFPCNQFGNQSPESDEETTQFCQLNYGTKFPQFSKIEVNGENETPLYSWLKSQKGFQGFDKSDKMGKLLDSMLSRQNPDYASNPDIKWNFTKFLIDRDGNVVARFEPTEDMTTVENEIIVLLKQ